MQHIVAVAALDVVVTTHVADDVVAGTTTQLVVAIATFDAVVATIAPDRVVTLAGDQDVVTVGATQHDVLVTGIADVVGVRACCQRAVAEHHLLAVFAQWVGIAQAFVELLALVHFQVEARVGEHQARQVGGRGVGHDQLGERVAFQFGVHRQASSALQVVEAVAVLQFLHLVLEHEVEGGAEHAAERGFRLRQAADPQVDGIDPGHGHRPQVIDGAEYAILARKRDIGIGTGAVEEVQAIGWCAVAAEHQGHGCRTFFQQRGSPGDGAVGAVGSNEVDQRLRMLQVLHQVDPAGVRLELGIAGLRVDVAAHSVQRRDTDVAAAGDVDRRQVQGQAEQVVAQRLGDELVDLVTGLAGDPAHDGAGGILGGDTAGGIRQRVEERRDQAQLLVGIGAGRVADDVEVDVEAVDGLGQHRVAEAVHGVCELGNDRRIEVDVIHLGRGEEQVDTRLHGAGELLEHQVLVLHFGTELGRLEQALAIPHQCVDCGLVGRQHGYRVEQPLVDEGQVTRIEHGVHGLRHQPVVLGVEDRMHGSQADVLVDPAVAGDVVRIEQLVVVGQVGAGLRVHRYGVAHVGIGIRHQYAIAEHRHGIVRDVGKELVAGAHGVGQVDRR